MEEHNEKPDIKIKKSKKINRLKIINDNHDNHDENIDELSNMFKVVSLENIEEEDTNDTKNDKQLIIDKFMTNVKGKPILIENTKLINQERLVYRINNILFD